MKRAIAAFFGLLLAGTAFAEQAPVNPWLPAQQPFTPPITPFGFPMPLPFPILGPQAPTKPYTMSRMIDPREKKAMMSMMMPMMQNIMHMSMKDAMNYAAVKYKAKPGLSFDDVVESMLLRANKDNFKMVGSNLMWKDFKAVLGDDKAPRVEVYSFCDIAVGRELLKIDPEFIVFLPCRIAVMEDADKNIWVLSIDWDMNWLGEYWARMGITDELYKGGVDIRNRMDDIMRAAANGDL